MSKYGAFIHHVHIADGFPDDCDELIHRCLKQVPLTYKKFCTIWKDMNLASMYKERLLGAEIAELTEEVLHIAKRYMVANTSNFEESVAGLYLVYGLLNLQPYPKFAALRIVPEDLPAITRIEVVARRERRLEVLYILGSVLIEGPCHFHVAQRERGAEPALRKYLEGYTGIDKQGIRPKGVFYRQNEELDIIRELHSLGAQYNKAKNALTNENGEVDRNLNYSDKNLAMDLETSLKKIINGLTDEEETPSTSAMQPSHSDTVQSIKSRAMKNVVGGVKHLMGVSERSKNKSPPKPSSSKSSPSTPTSSKSSPIKTYTSRKNPKRQHSSSSDSDSDDTISSVSTTHKITAEDINLHSEDSQGSFIEVHDANFICSLPVLVQPQNDDKIQIEFIDKFTKNHEKTNKDDEKSEKDDGKPAESSSNTFEGPVIQGPIGVFKIPEVTRVRKPRKDLKNSVLKSKFKRLGILPVTDMGTE